MIYKRWVTTMVGTLLLAFIMASAAPPALGASGSAGAFHLLEAEIDHVHAALKSGQITCRELVQLYINRIEAYNKNGPGINAIQNVNPRALQEAEKLDSAFKSSGMVGPLHCVPVLIKDQVETSDIPTTYGSAVFQNFVPKNDATVVTKLKKAGAIILGKTTMGEYASAYVGSAFGVPRNPYNLNRTAGGSSSGTGSGITANFGLVGIGEDTGGSARCPASFNSLVGLRPTLPLVSRYGMMPATPTLDTIGPIARTVRDAAILLGVIAGYDPNDPVTVYTVGQVPASYTAFLNKDGLKGSRIGVIRESLATDVEPSSEDYQKVKAVIDKAISALRTLGAEVIDFVAIPDVKGFIKKAYGDNQYETEQAINKYLARHPNAPAKNVREIILSGKVVPWRVSSFLPSLGKTTADPGYLQVLLAKEELRQTVLRVMADKKLDALVYATSDHQPTEIASDVLTNPHTKDRYRLGDNRKLAPALGFPAMTVPAGFTTDMLPVGIEFMGRPFAEGTLFKLTYAFEQGTHNRKPPTTTPPLKGEP
jgi:amidase